MGAVVGRYCLVALVAVVIACCVIPSCRKQIPAGDTVIYPAGWPLKELTAPLGSKRSPSRHNVAMEDPRYGGHAGVGETPTIAIYVTEFSYAGSWEEVKIHFRNCMEKCEAIDRTRNEESQIEYEVVDPRWTWAWTRVMPTRRGYFIEICVDKD